MNWSKEELLTVLEDPRCKIKHRQIERFVGRTEKSVVMLPSTLDSADYGARGSGCIGDASKKAAEGVR